MQIVKFLIGADGVHVGVKSESRSYAISGQLEPLPLCQTVHHFGSAIAEILYGEIHGAFHSVEIIVDSCAGKNE